MALRAGYGRPGQGEEAEEAFDRGLVALDLQLPGAHGLGERAPLVDRGVVGRAAWLVPTIDEFLDATVPAEAG